MSGSTDPGPAQAQVPPISIGDIPDAVFGTDLENRITHWAESAEQLFGYSAAEAVGRPFGELLPFRMRRASDETDFFKTIRSGRTWRGQGTVVLRGGAELWIESTVKPTVIDGEIVGSVSVSREITNAIETERFLAGEERFVTAVLDVAGALVVVLDRQGSVVRFNGAAERVSGYAASEVIGAFLWDLVVPADEVDAVRAAFADLRAGAFPNTHENHWQRRDGSRRLISWSNTCLVGPGGEVTHVVGTGIDITDERRAGDALHGIETVGRLLAEQGPEPRALDAVLAELETRMGYGFLSLYLRDPEGLRLGAQRGYRDAPERLGDDTGIIGRVSRTGRAALVPDVRADVDYVAGDSAVVAEVAVPLLGDGEILGVLNIESALTGALTEGDLRLAAAVADRLSSALLLNREEAALRDRVRLFAALTEFAGVASAILDPLRLAQALVDGVASVVPSDTVVITTLDRADGQYRIRAVRGVSVDAIGSIVMPGDGNTGRAIVERTIVASDHHARAHYTSVLRDRVLFDSINGIAVPLVREGTVLGVISIGRAGQGARFTATEREVLGLLGSHAALALANAYLHEEVSELAIHDGLTGLYNRRHFDASLELVVARWHRDRSGRRSLAAIMFDLDHFGRFNKDHGHQAGDAVLRAFAGILRERLRSSDLVARYGGEEFVVILEDCLLADAMKLAEEIRGALERLVIGGPDGQRLRARVSAGCSVLEPGEATKEALLRTADVALFMAKRGGRNRVAAGYPVGSFPAGTLGVDEAGDQAARA